MNGSKLFPVVQLQYTANGALTEEGMIKIHSMYPEVPPLLFTAFRYSHNR